MNGKGLSAEEGIVLEDVLLDFIVVHTKHA